MDNRHNEFVESLRNIMRNREEKQTEPRDKSKEEHDEDAQTLQELLEAKFDELFGPVDDDED